MFSPHFLFLLIIPYYNQITQVFLLISIYLMYVEIDVILVFRIHFKGIFEKYNALIFEKMSTFVLLLNFQNYIEKSFYRKYQTVCP